ncbi:uncharacterized protein C16orf96 homolog isoform X2 [Anolis carolinensis]|uniref:uncharacterized protein C16orf96 homolog isoform X2 n=1 Tax=Anolis carolinensis TaxID=28377 RepID=UPI000462BC79|nr:PREDICTED: uncharacterized protein C16orf96 homolog isoform X2 [Anolis carolinensis]|eukprot:XP_008120621.1 PREDICTED: uncharacterized protein C16orf96 homolog isoform X2 [Anolis carolinensis]
MSSNLSFSELINLAIGTPELGHVNFNALHVLLQGILDHLHLTDVKKEVTAEEMDFIRTPNLTPSTESITPAKKSSSLFHQLHERMAALERRLNFLESTPDTEQLLERSQGPARPAQEMYQMMQLQKKMELNEEAMNKAMKTLQDLLSNVYSLRAATTNVGEELGLLKNNFTNLGIEEMKERLQQLDLKAGMLERIPGEPVEGKEKITEATDTSDLVHWSSLCEMLTGKSFSEEEKECRLRCSEEMLATLVQLPEKQEALQSQIQAMEGRLKQQVVPAAVPDMTAELKLLMEQMDRLKLQEEQRRESLKAAMEKVEQLKEHCEKLQRGVDRLTKGTSDMEAMRVMLEQLDITKADKALIKEEMNVKADKSALEAKVNHGELKSATTQLSEMMQDLLQKMSLQDKDWQKALEKLFTDMDCKLDRMALDPLSQQLEEVWRFIKKFLSEGPRFDADSAAGFKKQLFERVKCISCDRPVNMATGPHMITVRKVPLRPRPASANGYEYLTQPQRKDLEAAEMGSGAAPVQTCWQCQAHHQACTLKRHSRSQDLGTVFPYGDPSALTYDHTEVDILGVNGVLYKGRLSSEAGERALAIQREFAAVKVRRPMTRMERARSAFADVSASPYAASPSRRIGSTPNGGHRRGEHPPGETLDAPLTNLATSISQTHVPNGGGMSGL